MNRTLPNFNSPYKYKEENMLDKPLSLVNDAVRLFQKFRRHPNTRISLTRSFMLPSTLVSVRLTHGIIYEKHTATTPPPLMGTTHSTTAQFDRLHSTL